jgi:cytosine/adenosine deaminase-related metal-dependent hydrolase
VLGLDAVGLIAPDHCADLVVWDLDDPAHLGLHDVAVAPVVSGRGRARFVLVAGEVRVRDGDVTGLDMGQMRAEAAAAVAHMQTARL